MSDKHLAKGMHDVVNQPTELWCEAGSGWRNWTEDIESATCLECLERAADYGKQAAARWLDLRTGIAKLPH